jgi:pyridinium-3,5-biscarboxylic acid mononucleotide sulfurtransferase
MSESSPVPVSPCDERSLVRRIGDGGRAVIALSGGVDSAVVAALAFDALGTEATAITLRGPAVAQVEVDRAIRVARGIGIHHEVLDVDPLARAEYRSNPTNRCYFCRSVEAERLLAFGRAWGARQYLDGIHTDDYSDDRPGLRAMDEAGFHHPLAEGGWTKADVRRVARSRHLANAEQPSDACLASRVAHGDPIDALLLGRIEAAETILLDRGFRRVRVRVRGGAARIEVDPSEVLRLSTAPLSTEVLTSVQGLGFGSVTIDPQGYGHRPAGAGSRP